MPNDPNPAYPVDVDRVLAVKTVREAGGRALFLAAVRALGRDEPPYDLERLRRLMRVEEHFQALLPAISAITKSRDIKSPPFTY